MGVTKDLYILAKPYSSLYKQVTLLSQDESLMQPLEIKK